MTLTPSEIAKEARRFASKYRIEKGRTASTGTSTNLETARKMLAGRKATQQR